MSNWPEYELAVAQYCENLCVHHRISEMVVTHLVMLATNCPVRETVLHKSNVYDVSFHLKLFCLHCVKVISHEKSFFLLPMLNSIQMNTWTEYSGEGCFLHRRRDGIRTWVPACFRTALADGRAITATGDRQEEIGVILTSRVQAWLDHLQGVKGRIPFKSVDRSVDSLKKSFETDYKMSLLWLGLDSLLNEPGSILCALVISLLNRWKLPL